MIPKSYEQKFALFLSSVEAEMLHMELKCSKNMITAKQNLGTAEKPLLVEKPFSQPNIPRE